MDRKLACGVCKVKLDKKIGLKSLILFLFMALLLMGGCKKYGPAAAGEESPCDADIPETATSVIDKVTSNLEAGNIAFNTPNDIMLGELAEIELLLSPKESIEKLQEMINAEGPTEGYEIKISNEMEARLSGTAFKIQALMPERQLVSSEKVTKWKWQVEPTRQGTHRLHLTLSAILYVHDSSGTYVIRTFDRNITVTVTFTGRIRKFITANWKWLWTAILVPVATWLIVKKRKKSNKDSSE